MDSPLDSLSSWALDRLLLDELSGFQLLSTFELNWLDAKAFRKIFPRSNQNNDTFFMWVEDGVVEFDYFAKNSYEYPRFSDESLNKTLYALHNGWFRVTAKEDQFISKHQFDQIMTDSDPVKVNFTAGSELRQTHLFIRLGSIDRLLWKL